MTTASGTAVRSDPAALKSDIGSLIEPLKGAAENGVHATADQISGGVCSLRAAAVGERSVKAIGASAEERPLLAFLIALGIGYVGVHWIPR